MFSVKYMGIYRGKVMAQHRVQKLETLTVVKLTTGILITQQIQKFNIANTEIYVYSETTFGGPTLGYVITDKARRRRKKASASNHRLKVKII